MNLLCEIIVRKDCDKMMNSILFVGRLTKDVEVKELEDGKKVANISLAVPRSFKNSDGVYETDFINCTLWGDKADVTAMYCQKGDIVGVRGRAESHIVKTNEGSRYNIEFVAERVTFLSNKSKKIEQELNQ